MLDKIKERLNLKYPGYEKEIEFQVNEVAKRCSSEESIYKNANNRIIAIKYEKETKNCPIRGKHKEEFDNICKQNSEAIEQMMKDIKEGKEVKFQIKDIEKEKEQVGI